MPNENNFNRLDNVLSEPLIERSRDELIAGAGWGGSINDTSDAGGCTEKVDEYEQRIKKIGVPTIKKPIYKSLSYTGMTAAMLTASLERLVESGRIFEAETPVGKVGRPTKKYSITPHN